LTAARDSRAALYADCKTLTAERDDPLEMISDTGVSFAKHATLSVAGA